MTAAPAMPRRGFTGWHMLAVVFAFFGTIITVNLVMAYYAVSTFPGLNAKNSYVASQNYNLLLADAEAQAERGWTGRIAAEGGVMELDLRTAGGAPLPGLSVQALAGRPASASTDRLISFEPSAAGYRATSALERGRWLIEIEAREAGKLVWRETRPLVVN